MSAPIKTAHSAADKAIDEKRELGKLYRARQRQEYADACADPLYGNQIGEFIRAIRKFGINDADAMIAAVTREATWLREAPPDIRAIVLRLIDSRIIAIRESNDMLPFDDPLPWQEDNVFRICKRELGL